MARRANGSQPIQRLAKALRPSEERFTRLAEALRPSEEETVELAAALQGCLDSAVEQGARRAEERIEAKFGPRFDKQDETLRMVWRQCGGDENKRLPIDD